ncbi:MAG: hypothetical protein NTZ32_18665 [Planctomycetales bacterium]|nr:hypothetical protein [Planctomycetales bacterium]
MDTINTLTDAQQAAFLRNSSASVYLTSSVGACLGNVVTPTGFRLYLEGLRQAAGNPTDPLQQMLWEQFAMAHHNLGRLYHRASGSATIDEATAYASIIIKLHAELRLLSETLHRLSKPGLAKTADTPPSRQGQSMAAARPADLENSNTQLTSNEAGEPDEPNVLPFAEPTARRRRPPKSVAATRAF